MSKRTRFTREQRETLSIIRATTRRMIFGYPGFQLLMMEHDIPESSLRGRLKSLCDGGYIEKIDGGFRLTAAGVAKLEAGG